MRCKLPKFKFLDSNPARGMTLVEMVMAMGMSGMLLIIGGSLYSAISVQSKRISGHIATEQEALTFLTKIRSSLTININNPTAELVQKEFNQFEAEGDIKTGPNPGDTKKTVIEIGTNVKIPNDSGSTSQLFQFKAKCTPLPSKIAKRLPRFSKSYFKTFVESSCLARLGAFECGIGQTPILTLKKSSSSRTHLFPVQMGNTASFRTVSTTAVAAVGCILTDPATDYTTISLYSAVYKPSQKNNPNRRKRLHWIKHDMSLPPTGSASGYTGYLP